jgi:hypothetical protein
MGISDIPDAELERIIRTGQERSKATDTDVEGATEPQRGSLGARATDLESERALRGLGGEGAGTVGEHSRDIGMALGSGGGRRR